MTPPIGDHACVAIPSRSWVARSSICVKKGCSSTWLTCGTTPVRSIRSASSLGAEVGDANCAGALFVKEAPGCLPCRDRAFPLSGHRLVQEVEVERVEPELAHAALEAVQRRVIAVVADPKLGRDEQLPAVDTAAADRLSNLRLVAVGRSGVDQAVSAASAVETACGSPPRCSGRRRAPARAWRRRYSE